MANAKVTNTKKYFTLDNINDIIEIFEDFLDRYNVRIPASDEEAGDVEENAARIYGTVYGDLQFDLLEYFEKLHKDGVVKEVVNSWDAEVETW